ncbi:MAG: hypothetical protein R3A10_16115 [Caldilineaceae bacterium]
MVVSDTIPTGTVCRSNDSPPPAISKPDHRRHGHGYVWTLGSNVAGTPGSTAGSIGSVDREFIARYVDQ